MCISYSLYGLTERMRKTPTKESSHIPITPFNTQSRSCDSWNAHCPRQLSLPRESSYTPNHPVRGKDMACSIYCPKTEAGRVLPFVPDAVPCCTTPTGGTDTAQDHVEFGSSPRLLSGRGYIALLPELSSSTVPSDVCSMCGRRRRTVGVCGGRMKSIQFPGAGSLEDPSVCASTRALCAMTAMMVEMVTVQLNEKSG